MHREWAEKMRRVASEKPADLGTYMRPYLWNSVVDLAKKSYDPQAKKGTTAPAYLILELFVAKGLQEYGYLTQDYIDFILTYRGIAVGKKESDT